MAHEPNKPDFSNVQSGSGSSAATPAAKADFSNVAAGVDSTAAAGTIGTAHSYTVEHGDSLSKIAKKVYGNANRWHEIFDANRDQFDNPDLIRPGQVLNFPAQADSKAGQLEGTK